MFGFSCFQTHTQSHRHKKMAHLTAAMPRTIDGSSDIEVHKKFTYPTNENSSNSKPGLETPKSCAAFPKETCVVDGHSYSDEVEILPYIADPKITHFKKSHSLGMGLDMKGKGSGSSASEDDIDQNFSSDGSQDNSDSCVQNEGKDSLILVYDQFQEGHPSDSLHACGDVGNHESVLSIGDAPQSEQESHANFDGAQFSGEANSDNLTTGTIFGRSSSLPNCGSPGHFLACSLRRIRSAEDLGVLLSKRKELFRHKSQALIIQNPGRIDVLMSNNGKNCSSNPVDGSYRDYNYFDSVKDWIIPLGHEVNVIDNHREGSFIHQKDELLSKDYKVKRIEEWVTDLQNCGPLEESDGHSPLDDHAVPADRIL